MGRSPSTRQWLLPAYRFRSPRRAARAPFTVGRTHSRS